MDVARMKRGISSNMSEVEQIRPKKMPCRAPPHDQDGRAFDRRENLILIPGTDPSD